MVRFEKINKATNELKYYQFWIAENMFGDFTLFRQWGRICSNEAGKLLMSTHENYGEARKALAQCAKTKQKDGYHLVTLW